MDMFAFFLHNMHPSQSQSCPTCCNPMDGRPSRLLYPWDSPGKNTGVGCYLITCRYLNDIPVYVYTYRSSQKKLQLRPGFLNTTFKLKGRWTPKKLFDHNFWKSRHMLSKFLLSQSIAKGAFHISVKEMMSKDTLVSDHNGNFYSMWKRAGLQPWGCSLVPSYFSSRLFHFFFFFVSSVSIFLQTVI